MQAPDDALPDLTRLLARAAREPDLRARLLADPRATLAAEGLQLAEDVQVKVVANGAQRLHLVLPAPAGTLDDAALDGIAGGRPAFRPFTVNADRLSALVKSWRG
jgi:hypothetical protein